jgi:hypothetical protein
VWQASGGEAWAKVKTIDFTFVVEKRGEVRPASREPGWSPGLLLVATVLFQML